MGAGEGGVLGAGLIPSLPELYPGEKDVDSIEIERESTGDSLQEQHEEPSFFESGRITLELPGHSGQGVDRTAAPGPTGSSDGSTAAR